MTAPPPLAWDDCVRFEQAVLVGGPGRESLTDSEPAPLGGIDRTGWYSETLVLDPYGAPLTLVPVGEHGHFLARFDARDTLVWAITLQGTSQANLQGLGPAADGGVFVGGHGDALSRFAGSAPIGGYGETDGFLARVDPDGHVLWLRSFGSTGEDRVLDLAVLTSGGFVALGAFGGPMTLGGGEPAETSLDPNGANGTWVARYTDDGALVWARAIHDSTPGYYGSIGYDSFAGAVVILGESRRSQVVFGEGEPNETVAPGQVYIASYSLEGEFRWVTSVDGATGAEDLSVTPFGGVFAVGSFATTATFLPHGVEVSSPSETGTLAPTWMARLDADGELISATSMSATQATRITSLSPDEFVVTAWYTDPLVLSPGGEPGWAPETGVESFLARLDGAGTVRCATRFRGGDSPSLLTTSELRVTSTASSEPAVVLIGDLAGAIDIGAGDAPVTITSAGDEDGIEITLALPPRIGN